VELGRNENSSYAKMVGADIKRGDDREETEQPEVSHASETLADTFMAPDAGGCQSVAFSTNTDNSRPSTAQTRQEYQFYCSNKPYLIVPLPRPTGCMKTT
jgi:hypothetical protein